MPDISRVLEILDQLIGFPTVSLESNLALIDFVADLLKNSGFEITRIYSSDRLKAGLFASIGPKIDGGICLSAHTDVVPVDGQIWTQDPFALSIEKDRVYGRGTTDMKGSLACALTLAERAKDQPLKAPLSLSISYDEEIGCVGIQEMMPELKLLIGAPRLVIVGEPTGMQVAIGHKGKTALDVTCFGEAGHSALSPDFINGIHVAAEFVSQIRHLQTMLAQGPMDDAYRIPYSTVHIGQIEGGRALNIVPAECVLKMEFRHLSEAPASQLLSEIEGIAKRVSTSFPNAKPIIVKQINAYPGLNMDPANSAVTLACELADGASVTKVPFGTEAGFFAELGLNTVVIGPGDMALDGHKPDEGISKSELIACCAMMDNILNTLTTDG
ncbi:acetylornithine deacetylase [Planktotalea sp.]|uniref:acetylornithine deacetylase n=1 Tax=Planktotalea sp. TaxID=2029877 RepID=UPI0025E9A9EE|nr:acetylornithine deacetylase [Planktotalea sp.]